VVLIVVMAWVTVFGPHQPSDFRSGALSAVFYVNNWYEIFHNVSYFAQFSTPEPLNHLWSLSVEEQFYIFWPFILIGLTKVVREVNGSSWVRPRLAMTMLALAFVSAVVMAVLYHPSIDPSRVYYGTDTRAQELLVGAAVACVWPSRRLRLTIPARARQLIDGAGILGLLVIGLMFWQSSEFSPFLYRGGFMLLSFGTALVVAAVAHPASRLGPILGCSPMRWIGQRSYGIYLWHFPIIILTTPSGTHTDDPVRDILQIIATFVVAALSWEFVEDPIRRGALKRLRGRQHVTRRGWAVIGASTVVVAAALAGVAGAGVKSDTQEVGSLTVADTVKSDVSAAGANRTQCTALVHIGDSTSEGLISPTYLPRRSERIIAKNGRDRVKTQNFEISCERSIYERFEGKPNAEDVAISWENQGFRGCWVLALGTNEAANVSAGSKFGYDDRIDAMMQAARGMPVLWVNTRSLLSDGPYAEKNMADWDAALLAACARYPNMRVYDWASQVKNSWFIDDGIHFTSEGYAARARLIAQALLQAFPAGGQSPSGTPGCLVQPPDNAGVANSGSVASASGDSETLDAPG
jgi:peptidoglycan/LPS O-acetylase OafA/YrhL